MIDQCPNCKRINEVQQSIDDPDLKPEEGAVGICWKCRTPYFFTQDATRAATPEEMVELMADADVKRCFAAMAESLTPSQAVKLARG